MDRNKRIIVAFCLIFGSWAFYRIILSDAMCANVMIDYTVDPNDGCTSMLNELFAPVFSFPILVSGLTLLAHTLGEDEPKNNSNSSNEVPSTVDFRGDPIQQIKDLGWAIVFTSGVVFAVVFVIGGILLLLAALLSGLSLENNDSSLISLYNLVKTILLITFLAFIGGLVIIVRPWKYVNAMADERTVSPKVTKQGPIQNCPGCQASVRFPVNFHGVAKCPRCAYIFEGSSSEE